MESLSVPPSQQLPVRSVWEPGALGGASPAPPRDPLPVRALEKVSLPTSSLQILQVAMSFGIFTAITCRPLRATPILASYFTAVLNHGYGKKA